MHTVKISVRNLVEFILRSGDIVSSENGLADPDAMQEGSRIHKKLQKRMGLSYQAEVPLSVTLPITRDRVEFELTVEGRADGIFSEKDGSGITIDEIKGIYRHLSSLKEPINVHRAQALCYAYIYALDHGYRDMGVRMTYCYIPTEEVKYFSERLTIKELETWFYDLVQEYAKWAAWQIKWRELRNASIKNVTFPFGYREGQKSLVKGVYQSILRRKRLYIEAPTGVGKTISTIFPTVKSVGEGLTEKIFYLTAKTITRTVAEEAFRILSEQDMQLKCVTLTAKEKICILDKPQCNPGFCPRALGHFDRVNNAVFDLLTSENNISREQILSYAEKHNVCPFEMSLDVSTWCDAIIGDYNYAFDPTASLKRFFAGDKKNDYVFLVDEAHNLVDRAREMYSATLVKEDFLAVKKLVSTRNRKVSRGLENCNKALLELKRECDELRIYDPVEIEPFVMKLLRLSTIFEEYLQNKSGKISTSHGGLPSIDDFDDITPPLDNDSRETLLNFYFDIRAFLSIYETLDDKYTIYSNYTENGAFVLHLQCMDPSTNLDTCLKKGRSAVFFSATLLPVTYYREQLAGREEDYAIYAPSPFSTKNRLLMIGRDVSTRYTRRGPAEYQKISDYILRFIQEKTGNYLIFFPSYRMMEDVREYLETALFQCTDLENPISGTDSCDASSTLSVNLYVQENSMTEEAREEFLSHFQDSPKNTTLGLCVMGGIFGEGIDLKDSRLIGAVIVGTGLPMVCTENELFREYFDNQKGTGFDYAYQYPGMNKVLQAAGRVIRTATDRGAILLLDERFLQRSYQNLFPREWYPYEIVNRNTMRKHLHKFWNGEKN